MKEIRKIVKDLVDEIPDEKLRKVFEILDRFVERDLNRSWSVWGEFGKDAVDGRWEDASERHDFYLYGMKR